MNRKYTTFKYMRPVSQWGGYAQKRRRRLNIFLCSAGLFFLACMIALWIVSYRFWIPRSIELPVTRTSPSAHSSANVSETATAESSLAPSGSASSGSSSSASASPEVKDGVFAVTPEDITYDDMNYKGSNLAVHIRKVEKDECTIFIADIHIRDGEYAKGGFAHDTIGLNQRETTLGMATRRNAIFAVNGDYYGYRGTGLIIRNGKLIRDNADYDVMAMFKDGHMEVIRKDDIVKGVTAEELLARGAFQTFSFGPTLVLDGVVETDFSKGPKVNKKNPRTALGYINDNHYIAIVVDGRRPGYSVGMTTAELAAFMGELGCSQAYNLDGGDSTTMVFMNKEINRPSGDRERALSDMLYFQDDKTPDPTTVGLP